VAGREGQAQVPGTLTLRQCTGAGHSPGLPVGYPWPGKILPLLLSLATFLLALTAIPGQSAEIYRWVDAEGRVHFGDAPPPEGAERVEVREPLAPDTGLAERRQRGTRLSEILEEDRITRDEARAEEIQVRENRQARCDSARLRLERAARASYIYKDSGDPQNPVILEEADRQQLERSLQEEVQRHCGAGNASP
jgi:Domain of unknown function (DUF4124)